MSSFKEFYLKLFATWLFFMVYLSITVLCGYILYLLMNTPGIWGLILSVIFIFIFVILVICLVLFSNTKVSCYLNKILRW